MPKTKQQHQKQREKTRKRIVTSALELMARKGYYGASMSQIAKKAGVSKGLIYSYFESKEALVTALLENYLAAMTPAMERLSAEGAALGQLEGFLDEMIQIFKNNEYLFRLYLSILLQPGVVEEVLVNRMPAIRQAGGSYGQQFVELFTKLGVEDIGYELKWLKVVFNGVLFNYLVNDKQEYPMEMAKTMVMERYGQKVGDSS